MALGRCVRLRRDTPPQVGSIRKSSPFIHLDPSAQVARHMGKPSHPVPTGSASSRTDIKWSNGRVEVFPTRGSSAQPEPGQEKKPNTYPWNNRGQ